MNGKRHPFVLRIIFNAFTNEIFNLVVERSKLLVPNVFEFGVYILVKTKLECNFSHMFNTSYYSDSLILKQIDNAIQLHYDTKIVSIKTVLGGVTMSIFKRIRKIKTENIALSMENERLKNMITERAKKDFPVSCRDCKSYVRHYIQGSAGGGFVPTGCGHCIHGKVRRKKVSPGMSVCDYFIPRAYQVR